MVEPSDCKRIESYTPDPESRCVRIGFRYTTRKPRLLAAISVKSTKFKNLVTLTKHT